MEVKRRKIKVIAWSIVGAALSFSLAIWGSNDMDAKLIAIKTSQDSLLNMSTGGNSYPEMILTPIMCSD